MHNAAIVATLGCADGSTAIVSACVIIVGIALGAAITDISG